MKLEKFQFWTDIVVIALTCINALFFAILEKWDTVNGWICAAIMSVNSLLEHRQTRHWWRKYCRAMGWEDEDEGADA
jgi:hypothetical protein